MLEIMDYLGLGRRRRRYFQILPGMFDREDINVFGFRNIIIPLRF